MPYDDNIWALTTAEWRIKGLLEAGDCVYNSKIDGS